MNTSRSTNNEYRSFTFCCGYENVHALLAEIHLYIFGAEGKLIETQVLRRGKATVSISESEWGKAFLVIAPPLKGLRDRSLTLVSARQETVFETEVQLEPNQSPYRLPPVPESIWRSWLLSSLCKNARDFVGTRGRILIW